MTERTRLGYSVPFNNYFSTTTIHNRHEQYMEHINCILPITLWVSRLYVVHSIERSRHIVLCSMQSDPSPCGVNKYYTHYRTDPRKSNRKIPSRSHFQHTRKCDIPTKNIDSSITKLNQVGTRTQPKRAPPLNPSSQPSTQALSLPSWHS